MFGHNPKRRAEKGDGSTLYIQEIFPTFQGEGPNTGIPAIFIRLGGCNLACSFCDTEFETFEAMSLEAVLNQVAACREQEERLIVITGGEPLRQNIAPLCEALLKLGYKVQIETNGTLYRELPAPVEIICSPKNTGRGYHPIRPDLLSRISALKFIVSADDPLYQDIAEVGQSEWAIPVYIQAMDEYDPLKNAANLAHARKLVKQHNALLSLQTHKLAGVA